MVRSIFCSRCCRLQDRPAQRYCRPCKALYMQELRKKSPALAKKQKAHSIAGYAYRSGKIKKRCCAVCGQEAHHKHHPSYNKPLDIIWLCRTHHTMHHRNHRLMEKAYVLRRCLFMVSRGTRFAKEFGIDEAGKVYDKQPRRENMLCLNQL